MSLVHPFARVETQSRTRRFRIHLPISSVALAIRDEAPPLRPPSLRLRPRQSPRLPPPDAPRSRRRRGPHREVEMARPRTAGHGGTRPRARAPIPRASERAEARSGAASGGGLRARPPGEDPGGDALRPRRHRPGHPRPGPLAGPGGRPQESFDPEPPRLVFLRTG